MKQIDLTGEKRAIFSKSELNALRLQGKFPAVLYGLGDNVHFILEERAVKTLIHSPSSFIVNLTVDGKSQLAVMRETQFHPVRDNILHMDFLRVDETKPVVIEIPVVLKGVAEGVKVGGKLSLSLRKLKVCAPLSALPDSLEIDITNLSLGKTIMVSELNYEGLEILSPKTAVVCAVKMTRAARGAAAAAAISANTKKK